MTETKEEYLFGKAPTHIESEDVLPYFLYVCELSWTLPMFIDKKDHMIQYMNSEVEKESVKIDELSVEKRWWIYTFIAMRDISIYHRLDFAVKTINHVIQRIKSIPELSLCRYANIFQAVLMAEVPDTLQVRPNELVAIRSIYANTQENLKFFLKKREAIVKLFDKHLLQRDLKKEYIDSVFMKDYRIMRRFSTMWNAYYELFVQYFLSVYDYNLVPGNMVIEELEEEIKGLILAFLVCSISSKEKVDNLHIELSKIVNGITELTHE